MRTKPDSKVFYSFNHICSYDAMWMMVCGGRGIGKTYGAIKDAIKDWIKTGGEFVYLRRYSTELEETIPSFFSAIERNNEFPGWDFRVQGRFGYASPVSERTAERRNWRVICRFVALSQAQQMKGVNFAMTTRIIFDEFILEKIATHYLPNEYFTMLNFYSTVDRNEDRVKVFMLSNSVSIDNPYFSDMDIDPDLVNKNGVAKKFDNKGRVYMVAHFPESHAHKDYVAGSRFGQFIAGSTYADFAVNNQFKDNHKFLIADKPERARYQYTLEMTGGTFSIWVDPVTGIHYIRKKLPKDGQRVFTMIVENMSKEKTYLTRSARTISFLRGKFNSGMVMFDHPSSRNKFNDIFRR